MQGTLKGAMHLLGLGVAAGAADGARLASPSQAKVMGGAPSPAGALQSPSESRLPARPASIATLAAMGVQDRPRSAGTSTGAPDPKPPAPSAGPPAAPAPAPAADAPAPAAAPPRQDSTATMTPAQRKVAASWDGVLAPRKPAAAVPQPAPAPRPRQHDASGWDRAMAPAGSPARLRPLAQQGLSRQQLAIARAWDEALAQPPAEDGKAAAAWDTALGRK